jgi:maleate isomerase
MVQIDYGARLRVGMIVPSGNIVSEAQVRAMLPKGVAINVTRLPLTGSSPASLQGMLVGLEAAAQLLAHARVDLIAFNCTAVSTFSLEIESQIKDRISRATGIPTVLTSEGIVCALKAVAATKVALLTPYPADVNEREIGFLNANGIEVVTEAGMGLDHPGDMASLTPSQWYDFVCEHKNPDAQAYFISCTAIRSAEVISALESELGRPVITSNQAIAWHCLRTQKIPDIVPLYGTLFTHQ